MRRLMKTTTYGIMHVCVATVLAYMLTGSIAVALSIGLIEPFVQTFFFYFHEKIWEGRLASVANKSTENNTQPMMG